MFLVKFGKGEYFHSHFEDAVSQKLAERFHCRYEAWDAAIRAYNQSCGTEKPYVVKLICAKSESHQ